MDAVANTAFCDFFLDATNQEDAVIDAERDQEYKGKYGNNEGQSILYAEEDAENHVGQPYGEGVA